MCDATTIGVVSTIGGTVVQAAGQNQDAQAAAQQAADNAATAERNAQRAEWNAKDAVARGAVEAGRITSKGTSVLSEQKTAVVEHGITLDSPLAANLATTTRAMTALDALTAKSNAARQAWGYEQDAEEYRKQAEQFRRSGEAAKRRSVLDPLGTVIGGAGAVAKAVK